MKGILPQNLTILAERLPAPLYLVGGYVRDFLKGLHTERADFDLASAMPVETVCTVAEACGFQVCAVYKNTGTVKLKDGENNEYEYTRFRHDRYVRGVHTPAEIRFTDDIFTDAKRRDFTCNAVYYDVKHGQIVDPLHGLDDIRAKRLHTVDVPEKVFGEDGLRLMRLARQAAQLGFSPTADCLTGAKRNARLILDISKERIFTELRLILSADKKYGNRTGHYDGLKILEEIGVFALLFPELALGKGQQQRKDFHRYDVLEHSFRVVLYAPEEIRLAALLHDVGKPFCFRRDGNTFAHAVEGESISDGILKRLGAPTKERLLIKRLVALHMYDFDCKTGEDKLRKFFVDNHDIFPLLTALKQADFSGCMDNTSTAPTVEKWQTLWGKMQRENAPLTLGQLAVKGNDLMECGVQGRQISDTLQAMLYHTAKHPKDNEKARLLGMLSQFFPNEKK